MAPEAEGNAESLRWILEKANSPEVHQGIRDYIAMRNTASDPGWRELLQDASVWLYGGPEGLITLPRDRNPALDKDVSALRDEAFQLVTSAGQVEVVVSFAQDVLATPLTAKGAARLRQANLGDMSPSALLVVVLMWLIAIGLPLAETKLTVQGQAVVNSELTTLGLALAITWRLLDQRDKKD